jgi:vacuolar-type H+-ATPase subunit H
MEIMEIIDMMEETVDKAPVVPLSGKILIDKEDILDYIQEMRLVFPDELKEAKWVKNERQRILSEAETKSEEMLKNAEDKMVQMVDENEITRQAYEQAAVVENETRNNIAQMKSDFNQYVNDMLNELENHLDVLVKKVQEDKINFNNN